MTTTDSLTTDLDPSSIAIVGMAAHLPGARNTREYWQLLRDGREAITDLTDDELLAAGVAPDLLRNPHYIKRGSKLHDLAGFDAEFFGLGPKEASIMDPQHRHFLETAWEALEDAGHVPERFEGQIGVFAGCGMGAYFAFNLLTNPDLVKNTGLFLLRHTGNDKDFLSTRVSYNFNLTGPSVNVQTACSTSLVAVHMASQSLLSGECDMALAGGVTIELPHGRGYLFQQGEIMSPSGHVHAFDHRATGTVFGSGSGVVVLRRLEDAVRDGDHIYAILKGSAVNNDGATKIGYFAPSVDGQTAAIVEALGVAGLSADEIDYIECHGTGTAVGDPIEIAALTQAFRQSTERKQFCGIGSVKTNIGHLDTAAGVASLIKVSLALEHQERPASLNYEAPNPQLNIEQTPFYVNHQLTPWQRRETPRRAGITSLGVGGTNAHAIVEEAPVRAPSSPAKRPFQLLTLSARNRAALDEGTQRLGLFLSDTPETNLADAAYTLHVGRRAFDVRRVVSAADTAEAARLLSANDAQRVFTHRVADKPSVVFMFPGGGAQYVNMGRDLYRSEPVFRQWVDRGLNALRGKTSFDLQALWFADCGENNSAQLDEAAKQFERPAVQLPAIFIVEYALAQLWQSWGVKPAALIGHSMGENTAACLAGVMSFEDCLGLVTLRGKLMEQVPEGGMLSIPLSADDVRELLGDELDLATVNAPELCTVSGPVDALERLRETLLAREIEAKRVPIKIAAHSRLLDSILEEFGAYLRRIKLNKPTVPVISNRTGAWLTDEQATSPQYWVEHLRGTVWFAEGIGTLLKTPGRVLLEVGPGKLLGSLVRQHRDSAKDQNIIASLRHPKEPVSDEAFFVTALGRLWASGVDVPLGRLWQGESRQRVSLPTYAFQHEQYWIAPGKPDASADESWKHLARLDDPAQWYFRPTWKPRYADLPSEPIEPQTWLVFNDTSGVGERLVARLRAAGHEVVTVEPGDAFHRHDDHRYTLSPEHGRDGYDALLRDLASGGRVPRQIVHLWLLTADESFRPGSSFFHRVQEQGFYSLLFLAQAWQSESLPAAHVTVLTNGMTQVESEPLPYPEKATVLGPSRVLPRELPGMTCATVDLVLPQLEKGWWGVTHIDEAALDGVTQLVWEELQQTPRTALVAHRQGKRYEQIVERVRQPEPRDHLPGVRDEGVYLITGGLGGIGLSIATHLASQHRAKLVLVGRSHLPPPAQWDAWLRAHSPDDSTSKRIRQVRELETLGAEVLVISADVTDVVAMAQALDKAQRRFGALHGVIHAAGVLRDGLMATKPQSDIEDVFTPKIHGTLVLDELLRSTPLDFMVVFSSSSTATAPAGQVDYVAANAFLNAYAQSRSHVGHASRVPGAATSSDLATHSTLTALSNSKGAANTHSTSKHAGRVLNEWRQTVALAWGVWNEVGMAAVGRTSATTHATTCEATSHPLFATRCGDQHSEQITLTGRLSPATHWLLDEHRTATGHALIPGTGYLELMRAALVEIGVRQPFEIADLFFLRPLYVADQATKDVRVKLQRDDEGYWCAIQSRVQLDDGRVGWEQHAQARLLLDTLPDVRRLPLVEIDARCTRHRQTAIHSALHTRQEEHLRFGPRWHVLRELAYGEHEAIARLELPEAYRSDLPQYALHPALMDLATGYAMDLLAGYEQCVDLWVPVSYRQLRVYGPLPQRVVSWVRNHGENRADAEFATFDVTIADESGRVLVEVREFTIHRLPQSDTFGLAPTPSAAELELEPSTTQADRQPTPAEEAFAHNLSHGITPAEGVAAFLRVVQSRVAPQIIVSSLDVPGLIAQTERLTIVQEREQTTFTRPKLDSEFVEPRDDVERTLCGIWQELLGVSEVGIRDNFFELGGHSLIAVRLFTRIKKTFAVEFPMSILFEAPTIEGCATLIRESGQQHTAAGSSSQPGDAPARDTHRTRYTHLVAMHDGNGAHERPLFIVAGMFGNVLNLRHLAHLVGQDRPCYGLQARGLYGDHPPHETFEEAATEYLRELRSVQPSGPYLLGGFSGGGITAYEMARQLIEQGEEVAMLVMLDTPLPMSEPLTFSDKLKMHLQRIGREKWRYVTHTVGNRIVWELTKRRKQRARELGPQQAAFHNLAIEAAFYRACGRYAVTPLPLTITLFRPKLNPTFIFGPDRMINADRRFIYHDNGWSRHVAGVDVHEVPGDHDSMVLEPNVRTLGNKLRQSIRDIEARIAAAAEPVASVVPPVVLELPISSGGFSSVGV